jgi:flagellar basal-body rod protein FlgB
MRFDQAFGMHEQALKLRAKRAEVLAGNIANVDTPGYKARDFDFNSMLQQEVKSSQRLATTNSRHIQTAADIVPPSQMGYRVPSQPSLDGNTVDSQLEHSAFASNALEYQASLRFVSGAVRTLRTAIKGQ